MNKIKLFTLALGAVAMFAACHKEAEVTYVNDNVKVVASSTSIEAKGGSGSVEVDKTIASAKTNASWLTVSTSGSKVSFTAEANDDREARNAKLVIRASQDDSVVVAVSQNGVIYNARNAVDVKFTNKANIAIVPIETDLTVVLGDVPAFAKAEVVEGGIEVSVDANTTGPRADYLTWTAGKYEGRVLVSQFESSDMLGDWALLYYNSSDENWYFNNVTITSSAMSFPDYGFEVSASIDADNFKVNLTNGDYLGTYGPYYLYNMFLSDDGYISFSSSPKGAFSFEYVFEDEALEATFGGDFGGGATSVALLWGAFNADSFAQANWAGPLSIMESPMLVPMKVLMGSASVKSAAASKPAATKATGAAIPEMKAVMMK